MDSFKKIEEMYAKKHHAVTTTRKSIGDFLLTPKHPVNVKSNNVEKNNYSPNIISASRLLKWLLDDQNQLSLIFVNYKEVNGEIVIVSDSGLVPIEHISWSCLSIQAQGNGVIQKSSDLVIDKNQNRNQFLLGLKNAYYTYMKKERAKFEKIEKLLEKIQ